MLLASSACRLITRSGELKTKRMEKERVIEVLTSHGSEEIHIVRTGSGACQFLVWHGFNSVNRFFHWKYLHKYGEVIRVGLPGHGPVARKSWSHYQAWTQEHFVETGVAVCKDFYTETPLVLVGHSMGGHIALGVVTRMPKMIAGFVLVNPMLWSPFNGLSQFLAKSPLWRLIGTLALGPGILKAQRSVDAFLESIRRIIGDHEAFYGNPNTRSYTEAGHGDYKRNCLPAIVGAARIGATFDLRPSLKATKISVPTLLIHGDKDRVAPIAQSEWVAHQMLKATLVRFPGVGHLCYGEREDEFAELVMGWLDKQLVPLTTS